MFDALLLRLGRATAATLDVPAALADVCRTLHPVLGVRGVVVAVGGPADPLLGPVVGSDDTAAWIGRVQRDARGGPLAAVSRSGRPLLTGDLLRVGPPELAAAAADAGITEAMTVPLTAGGHPVGALQLLGDPAHPAGPGHAEPLGAVLDVLAARLADVEQLRGRRPPEPEGGPVGQVGQVGPVEPAGSETTAVIPISREHPGPQGERRSPQPERPDGPADDDRPVPVPRPEQVDDDRPDGQPDSRVDAPDLDPVTDRFPEVGRPVGPADATSVLPAAGRDRSPHPGSAPAPHRPDGPPPPAPRPPGPSEVRVPVPRYHEPGASTFGAAADQPVDDGTEAAPPPVASGAGAPAGSSGRGAVDGAPGPRPGRRRREP